MPEGHRPEAEKVIDAIKIGSPVVKDIARNVDTSRKSPAWDDKKITEHHAIIPTSKVPLSGALSEKEQRIYDLICIRYLLQFLPEYEYEQTIVEFAASDEIFKASGRHVLNLGWMGWDKGEDDTKEKEDDDKNSTFPLVAVGEIGNVAPMTEEKTTTPPKRFTYDSLLAAMIGTPATQENTIKLLFDRGFFEKQKKQIISTALGRGLIDILNSGSAAAAALAKPDITALWEQSMTRIEAGELKLESFLSEVGSFVRGIVSEPLTIGEIPGALKLKNCLNDECGGYLSHIEKDKNKFFICSTCSTIYSDRNGEPVAKTQKAADGEIVEADCPLNCGKKARQFDGQYGKYWRCFCSPGTTFKDAGGKPVVREERPKSKCPVRGCKGQAEQIPKKDGGKFWKCGTCGNTFNDENGKPVLKKKKEAS